MTNFRDPLAPYKGYFIMRINRCQYYVNRIINPAKENLKGKNAVYGLTWNDLVYTGNKEPSLKEAHEFIRKHKRQSGISNEKIWEYREKFRLAPKSEWKKIWKQAEAEGIREELRNYVNPPITDEGNILF